LALAEELTLFQEGATELEGQKEREQDREPEKHLLPLEELRSEVNLLLFPFFALNRCEVRRKRETEFRAIVTREGRRLEILWNVSANPKYGYPGPLDKKVHKAIEQIINEQGLPVRNPVPFTFYDLCKRLGLPDSGKNIRNIKQALKRVKAATIESRGAFYSKSEAKWIEDVFSLYERVIFKGERLPDGTIADKNYIYLGSWYIQSINAQYVKPLDFGYYKSLESSIAQRLYELLGVKFFGAIRGNRTYVRYKYSTLCQLLPLTRQTYPSYVKRQLEGAHQELIRTGFLSKVVWRSLDDEEKDWFIHYYPGPRAKEEVERFTASLLPAGGEATLGRELSCMDEGMEFQALPALTQEQKKLVESLIAKGVTKFVAEELVRGYDQEHIKSWLAAIGHVKAEDRAAYLVKAIREGWALPEAYKRALRKRELEEQRRQAEEAERRKREEELKKWAVKPLEEKVQEALERWLMIEKAFNRQPSEEAIAAKREELIKYYQSTAPRSSSSGS
jgi:hypothetical protein